MCVFCVWFIYGLCNPVETDVGSVWGLCKAYVKPV